MTDEKEGASKISNEKEDSRVAFQTESPSEPPSLEGENIDFGADQAVGPARSTTAPTPAPAKTTNNTTSNNSSFSEKQNPSHDSNDTLSLPSGSAPLSAQSQAPAERKESADSDAPSDDVNHGRVLGVGRLNTFGDVDLNNQKVGASGDDTEYSKEDEEIARARAMAMAIASNPNLTPDQLQRIVQAGPDSAQAKLVEAQKKASSLNQINNSQQQQNLPHKWGEALNNMFNPNASASDLQSSETNVTTPALTPTQPPPLLAKLRDSFHYEQITPQPTSSSSVDTPKKQISTDSQKQQPQTQQKKKNQIKSFQETMREARLKWKEITSGDPNSIENTNNDLPSTSQTPSDSTIVHEETTVAPREQKQQPKRALSPQSQRGKLSKPTTTTPTENVAPQTTVKATSATVPSTSNATKTAKHETAPDIAPNVKTTEKLMLNKNVSEAQESPKLTEVPTKLPSQKLTTSASENLTITSSSTASVMENHEPLPIQERHDKAAATTVETTSEDENPPPQLSSVLWKRRSGFGKLSSNAWERRRVTLCGSVMAYFKTKEDHDDDYVDKGDESVKDVSTENGSESAAQDTLENDCIANNDMISTAATSPTSSSQPQDTGDKGKKSGGGSAWNFFEQAVQNARVDFRARLAEAGVKVPASGFAASFDDDPNAPRGELDIVAESATIAVSPPGAGGGPTPFCLAIRTKGETKWKFCFDSHSQQMQWLVALTDIVVKKSVDDFNNSHEITGEDEGLNEDGKTASSASGSADNTSARSLMQTPQPALERDRVFSEGTGQTLKKIWKFESCTARFGEGDGKVEDDTQRDQTQANSNQDEAAPVPTEEVTESNPRRTDESNEDSKTRSVLSSNKDDILPSKNPTMTKPDRQISAMQRFVTSAAPKLALFLFRPSEPSWSLYGPNFYLVLALMNGALLYSRASSRDGFWTTLTFLNLAVWLCVVQDKESEASTTGDFLDVQVKKSKELMVERPGADAMASEAQDSPDIGTRQVKEEPAEETILLDPANSSSFKPLAGSTSMLVESPKDKALNKEGHQFCGYRIVEADTFQVRSRGYLKTKKKIPSPSALYDLVAVDVFESGSRYPNMAEKVILPEINLPENDAGTSPKTWHCPDIFVVSLAIPTEAPKLGRATDDGRGFTVTAYFTMKSETRNILQSITASDHISDAPETMNSGNDDDQRQIVNAVRLFNEWCRRSPTDPTFQSRFKLVPNANNFKEIGMPGWISKYNGKPVLIKRSGVTGFLFNHPEHNVMEFDISIHPFPYLAKQATAYMKEHFFKKFLVSFGFVIEGRNDDELPEVLIGDGAQLCYPDPALAIQGEDWFAGRSPVPDV